MKKIFYFILLTILTACTYKKEEEVKPDSVIQQLTYHLAYTMDFNGQNKITLASSFRPWKISAAYASTLMFKLVPFNNSTSFYQLFVANASGTSIQQVTNSEAENIPAGFFPAGDEILFTSKNKGLAEKESELYAVNTDGSGLQRLTTNDYEEMPVGFLEKKKRILFLFGHGGLRNLYVLKLE